ncbi:spindle pole body protein pcp1-like [Asbolus verrucosus]|uniref:Spindle pole body protein pcp1-like n=1 Tax=Asbolus verrucosus TaxID=1661398 RepID=A0A482WEU4_ASBVE|nr:spindle pole body protein pcp1-like [Asbolus verrucosus]
MKLLEASVEEQEATIDDLLKQNKMAYVTIDNIKQKIKENTEKKYLLERKSQMLKDDIREAEDVLTLARNLTPVEMEDSPNGNEIAETLRKCAEKLQKLIDNMTLPNLEAKTCENSPKRESLGLLPDSYLDVSDEFDDVFLLSPPRTDRLVVKPLYSSAQKGASSSLFDSAKKTDCDIVERLCNDKYVKDVLKNLLYKHNRQLILKNCQIIYETQLAEVRNSTLECNRMTRTNKIISQDDLNELYFIHLKNELEKDKYRKVLKKLQESVRRRKEEISSLLMKKSKNSAEELRIFELQIEEAEVIAANNFLHKEISSMKSVEISNELQLTSAKIKQTKDEIAQKLDCIQNLVEKIYKIIEYIKNCREETSACVRALGPYILDLSWADRLKEDVHSDEIKTFEDFPVEYNRKFIHNESKIPYRNICDSTVPSDIDLDSNNLEMVTTLMDTPFSSAESIILSMLQSKVKMNILRSLQPESVDFDRRTYSAEELSRGEEYIEPVIKTLNSLINSSSVKQVLSAPDRMKEVADLWEEMPLKDFISDKRLVEGHNYKFYEKMFDNYSNF